MIKRCHYCNKIAEGKVETYLLDTEKDETYEEFFCYECLGFYNIVNQKELPKRIPRNERELILNVFSLNDLKKPAMKMGIIQALLNQDKLNYAKI